MVSAVVSMGVSADLQRTSNKRVAPEERQRARVLGGGWAAGSVV